MFMTMMDPWQIKSSQWVRWAIIMVRYDQNAYAQPRVGGNQIITMILEVNLKFSEYSAVIIARTCTFDEFHTKMCTKKRGSVRVKARGNSSLAEYLFMLRSGARRFEYVDAIFARLSPMEKYQQTQ